MHVTSHGQRTNDAEDDLNTEPRAALSTMLALMCAVAGGCKDKNAASVVAVTPQGEAKQEDLRTGIRIKFDKPVVAASALGAPLQPPPVTLNPGVPGTVVWLDTQTLVFTPAQKLLPSTKYEVSLDPKALGKTVAPVASWAGASFVYERLRVRRVAFEAPGAQFQSTAPVLTVAFTAPVPPADAARQCLFVSDDGKKTNAKLGGQQASFSAAGGEEAENGDSTESNTTLVRLSPEEKLQAGAGYKLRCRAGLKPAGGGEGLAKDEDAAFRTYGALRVVKVSPDGRDVIPDDATIKLELSTPVEPSEIREHVRLMSEGDELKNQPSFEGNATRTVYSWKGDLEPNTGYRVQVTAGLKDVFGQTLESESDSWFRAGDAGPRLRLDRGIYAVERSNGKYSVWTRNLQSFEMTCARIPESRLATLLSGPVSFDSWYGGDDKDVDYKALGVRPLKRTVKTEGAKRNKWHDASLDLAAVCGATAPTAPAPVAEATSGAPAQPTVPAQAAISTPTAPGGVYLVELDSKELKQEHRQMKRRVLANVTDLGLLAKVGNASSLIWVVRLSSGEPVPGAAVRIRDLKGKVRFSGTTGTDGTVGVPGVAKLLGLTPKPASSGEDHDEAYEDWDSQGERRVVVTAQTGDDLAVLDTNWNNGIQLWNFNVTQADRRSADVRVRGFLQSDRGLYRPGDTVHLRGLVRAIDVAGKMRVPAKAKKVHMVIEDPRGKTLIEEDVPVTAFGGFNRDLNLDSEARLGDYRVKGTVLGQTFADKFSVEEYRPRTFEVKLGTAKKHLVFGQKIGFTVAADYLYGAPLKGGKLKWGVRRRAHTPSFPAFAQYTFQDMVRLWDEGSYWSRYEERSFSSFVQDGEQDLDNQGRAKIVARDDDKAPAGPQDYLIEATVTDSRGEGVTASQALVMHRSPVYLGLRTEEYFQTADAPFALQAVALTPEGKRRAVTGVELTLTRSRWDCNGDGPCRKKTDSPAVTRKMDIPEAGVAVENVTLREPGSYAVRMKYDDGHGGSTIASDTIYIMGKGETFWSADESEHMTLVTSRPKYKKGETAKLMAQANLPGSLALVTLERDGVMTHQVKRLESTGEALEVAIEPRFAPNVYASVTLVRGRTAPGEKGKPRFKMGVTNLEVDTSDRRLKVAVETDHPSYRPGDTVTATVKVTNDAGAPVKAEVALAAADEGVLQIAGYKTPDPMPTFYAAWGLGVDSSTTWNRIARVRDPAELLDGDDEGEGGDAGGEEAGRVRSRFMATAYWNPALVTSSDGTARVTFTAPDNLTAFRVMAVAADTGERFGSGEKRFAINKPLQAMAALPRFLSLGDNVNATVVLHNNTKAPLKVTVTAAVNGGVRLQGEPSQIVEIPASGAKPAAFPAIADAEGEAQITFRATGGGEADAVLTKIPVERPTTTETLLLGEGSATKRAEHAIVKPNGVLPGRGRLELVLDGTGLSRLDEGLSYLVKYPYGCLEQTTSKVVPMVALGDLAGSLDLPEVNQAKLKHFVSLGLAKVLKHQHDDGGFGLWIGAPVEQHYTAFGLWGLAVAKRAGWDVDSTALDRGARWLRQSMARDKDDGYHWMGVAGSQSFALYVLAELQAQKLGPGPDTALMSKLMDQRARLPRYGRAFLARAMSRAGRQDDARKLIDELAADLAKGSGPLVVTESSSDDLSWYWSSDARTTAIVLGAFVEAAPNHPLIERMADGLLGTRSAGRWENTQENLYSLLALADLARARANGSGATVSATAGGKSLFSGALKGAEVRRVSLPLEELGNGGLTIETDGAPVYYMARVHAVRALDDRAVDAGIVVKREYLDAESGRAISQAKLGQVVKVRLTLNTPKSRAHVAVVDRLPAGLEPVLDRFQRQDDEEHRTRWWWARTATEWQNRQLHDDRVELFTDVLVPGESRHEYLARAMSTGTFTSPGAMAEMMYKPTMNGRSAGGKLDVIK